MQSFKLKIDMFKKNRGGYSRLLNVFCRKCNHLIVVYQKDGPGNLRRLYLDRIFLPKKLTNLESKQLKRIQILKCKKCNQILGTHHIYEKENRKAYRLYQDAVIKKVRRLRT